MGRGIIGKEETDRGEGGCDGSGQMIFRFCFIRRRLLGVIKSTTRALPQKCRLGI